LAYASPFPLRLRHRRAGLDAGDGGRKQLQLRNDVGGQREFTVLADALDGSKVEHAVANDRPSEISTKLLPIVWGFRLVGLLREIVFGRQRLVAQLVEPGAVQGVRPRLGGDRDDSAARLAFDGIE